MTILELVKQHGGIARVHTHPATVFDRTTGSYRRKGWTNTIVCRDGWKRTLTVQEQRELISAPAPDVHGDA